MRCVALAVILTLCACTKTEPKKLLPWEERADALPDVEHATHRAVRTAFAALEAARATQQRWPEPSGLPDALTWRRLEHGSYTNYLGVPSEESTRRRWLVLVIEPPAGLLKQAHEPVVTADEEHHLLPDGTLLHVSLWSQPNVGALPVVPLPLPGEDGWVQSVGE